MSETRRPSRILPSDKGAAPLDVVIGVMALLAALALGASLVAERAASGWRAGLSDRLTVQVLPPARGNAKQALDAEADAALSVLRGTQGIAHASKLSEDDTTALVEPWLGKDAIIAELPLPKLIDATIVPGTDVDMTALSRALKQAAPDAVLDDHRRWLARLSGLADTVIWSASGILALIAVATAATVAFATRAGLEAHHEMVALLHQMGAHAGFIARAFERHYFVSALLAAAAGASAAAAFFVAAGGLELVGVEAVPFLPPIGLKLAELPWLLAVPIAAAVIAFGTARISVLAALRDIY